MKQISKINSIFLIIGLSASFLFFGVTSAHAEEIDVSYLQTCLKEEGSSLDVLVLMDGSASLRNSKEGDSWHKKGKPPIQGSDPEKKRGKILKSSLLLLQKLASDSSRPLNVNLRTFGENSDPEELKKLEENSVDWTDASKSKLSDFIDKALYDDSTMTEWASALASAKNQFKKRLGEAALNDQKSCPIMFWITDGAPTDSTELICASNTNSSIDWFRENNVLVLGGLLQPREERLKMKAQSFRPIVTGENCGRFQEGWTKGEVIEAKDIGDLAWGFVGLVASLKNLINLKGTNSAFYVDPGSSHIEIFIRGSQARWEIYRPDGTQVCSSNSSSQRCQISQEAEIGITTVKIFPENPAKSVGVWTVTPKLENENFKVYGTLNTASKEAQDTQPRLLVTPASTGSDVDEGEKVYFNSKIINPDGTNFNISGFKNVSICAKVASSQNQTCKSGSNSADLSVTPVTTDKSVAFEAILTSAYDDGRNYRIAASQRISVLPSGIFPTLECNKDPCIFKNLKNKADQSVNLLKVVPAKNGNYQDAISLVSFTVLSDTIEKRGDGHFKFEAQKLSGEKLSWPSENQLLTPGDQFKLMISTDMAGDSDIRGVIKYKVYAGEQEIIRQLGYKFSVGSESNKFVQFGLLFLAYLLTIGLPYLFLLWSSRRAAVLNIPYNELAYLKVPFEIGLDGKIREKGNVVAHQFTLDYKKLINHPVEPNSRRINIDEVIFEVVPPKWNPFSETKTVVRNNQNFLFSTYGQNEIFFESAPFNPSILDEAIFYFSKAGNIEPQANSGVLRIEGEIENEFMDSAYESQLSQVPQSPTMPVQGYVLFIVSPYVTEDNLNKEKSLSLLLQKLPSLSTSIDFVEKIRIFREVSLSEYQARVQLEKSTVEKSTVKKISEPETVPLDDFGSVDEWGVKRTSDNKESGLPESRRNEDSW